MTVSKSRVELRRATVLNMQKVMCFLMFLFVAFSLIAPILFVNKLLFATIALIYLVDLINHKARFATCVPFVILLIFSFGLLQGLAMGGDRELAIQFTLSVFMLCLIYPINFYKINMTSIIKRASVIYLIASCCFVVYGLNQLSFHVPAAILYVAKFFDNGFFNWIGSWLKIYGEGAIGYRTFFAGFDAMIHLGTVPFLLIPIGLFANDMCKKSNSARKRWSSLLFVIMGIFVSTLSTSRALILCEAVIVAVAILANSCGTVRAVLGMGLILLATVAFFYISSETDIFSLTETSNNTKIGHITGYLEYVNIKNFLIGDGLATYYYSFGAGKMVAHTEITLLDFMRYFGVIPAFAIYVMLFLPFHNRHCGFRRDKYTLLMFILYIFISITNPVLFNSLGMIVILWYWNDVLTKRRRERKKSETND